MASLTKSTLRGSRRAPATRSAQVRRTTSSQLGCASASPAPSILVLAQAVIFGFAPVHWLRLNGYFIIEMLRKSGMPLLSDAKSSKPFTLALAM